MYTIYDTDTCMLIQSKHFVAAEDTVDGPQPAQHLEISIRN